MNGQKQQLGLQRENDKDTIHERKSNLLIQNSNCFFTSGLCIDLGM